MSDETKTDLQVLARMVQRIQTLLTWLVFHSKDLEDLRREYQVAFVEIRERLKRLEGELLALDLRLSAVGSLGTEDPDMVRLQEAGLTGHQLRLKDAIFDWLVKNKGRRVKWLLLWANSVLGSLTSVFGWLEPVREFKEGVELVVTKRRWPAEPPVTLFPH